ncbi:hypothetical protein B0H21DRAFT_532423 [Amylocystis lapponica]|nr:hypothetical protein B0H21DRAFT_532423 [Amylocystis lapponica]
MIIHDDDKKAAEAAAERDDSEEQLAGPSTAPPPSFEESVADQLAEPSVVGHFPDSDVYVPQGGEEPPPDFTPYRAEYFVTGSQGDIVSHDRHLNEDGEALYRFLLSHSQVPPTLLLHVHGSHTESRTREVNYRDNHGHFRIKHEHYTEDVIDFNFDIDISRHIVSGPVHWSRPDNEPAYRGGMVMEVDAHDAEAGLPAPGRQRATARMIDAAKAWQKEQRARGLPPWAGPESDAALAPHQTTVLRSSKTLRQWADEYCASDKLLKEFTYERIVYGWHFANVVRAVHAAIKATYYTGTPTVAFQRTNTRVHIRPDNRLARTLSNKWLLFLLWLLLVFPLIWLYKRFGARGGGRWEVCGGAYALKSWQLVDPAQAADLPPPFSGADAGRMMDTAAGPARLVGLREGEWFQQWEGTIRRAVAGRLKTSVPLTAPDGGATEAAMMLDGYQQSAVTNLRAPLPYVMRPTVRTI